MNRHDFLKIIDNHIKEFSYHITIVKSKVHPRFAYTIGNYRSQNCEFILAGNINFEYEDLKSIFNEVLLNINNIFSNENIKIQTSRFGSFSFIKVHPSWSSRMMLGVYDYYDINNFPAYQIIPDDNHFTMDIPNMAIEWSSKQPIWKWLDTNIVWDLGVPKDSMVITNVDSLFGKRITEVMRWEENEWEAFTQNGEEIPKENIRIVPISVLLGIDGTLKPILKLDIGKGFFRDEESMEWSDWG